MANVEIDKQSEDYYAQKVVYFEKLGYNECEAQMKALEVLSQMLDINCKEVCL